MGIPWHPQKSTTRLQQSGGHIVNLVRSSFFNEGRLGRLLSLLIIIVIVVCLQVSYGNLWNYAIWSHLVRDFQPTQRQRPPPCALTASAKPGILIYSMCCESGRSKSKDSGIKLELPWPEPQFAVTVDKKGKQSLAVTLPPPLPLNHCPALWTCSYHCRFQMICLGQSSGRCSGIVRAKTKELIIGHIRTMMYDSIMTVRMTFSGPNIYINVTMSAMSPKKFPKA